MAQDNWWDKYPDAGGGTVVQPGSPLKQKELEAGISQKEASAGASSASAENTRQDTAIDARQAPVQLAKDILSALGEQADVKKRNLELEALRANRDSRPPPSQMETVVNKLRTVVKNTVGARKLAREMYGAVGFGSDTLSGVGGTPATDVRAKLDNVGAKAAFDALADMRAQSPTGGALGQITEKELDLLTSTVGAINPNQSSEAFMSGTDDVLRHYIHVLNKLGSDPTATAKLLGPDEIEQFAPEIKSWRVLPEDHALIKQYVDRSRADGSYDPQTYSALMAEAYSNATGGHADDNFLKFSASEGERLGQTPELTIDTFDSTATDAGLQDHLRESILGAERKPDGFGETLSGAAWNFAPSTINFAWDTVKALTIDAPQTLGGVANLMGDAVGITDGTTRDAIAQHFKEKYGTAQGFTHALKTDPASIAADVAGIFTGGATIAAKGLNLAGKVGRIGALSRAAAASEAFANYAAKIDPMTAAGAMARAGVKAARTSGDAALSIPAHVAGVTVPDIKQSFGAGRRQSQEFRDQMYGDADPALPSERLDAALGEFYQQRGSEYRRRMARLNKDEPLDFAKVDDAIEKVREVGKYKGLDISGAGPVWDQVYELADEWVGAGKLSTVEDFDAFKRAINNRIRNRYQVGTPEYKVANDVSKAVHNTIIENAPEYAKIMREYHVASSTLDDLKATTSSGAKSTDTTLRKLQRQVSGKGPRGRTVLDLLESTQAGKGLGDMLAGQVMAPTESAGLINSLSIPGSVATGNPGLLALNAITPRVVGENAYRLGDKYGVAERAISGVMQQPATGNVTQRLSDLVSRYQGSAQKALRVVNPAVIQPQVDPYSAPQVSAQINPALLEKYGTPVPVLKTRPAGEPTLDSLAAQYGPATADPDEKLLEELLRQYALTPSLGADSLTLGRR